MQAKKYKIEVFESMLDWTHDAGQTITEFYVPELHVVVNDRAIFHYDESEHKEEDGRVSPTHEVIELNPDVVDSLKALLPLIDVRDSLEKRIRKGLGLKDGSN